MAEDDNLIDNILGVRFRFNDRYGLSYITKESYNYGTNILSRMVDENHLDDKKYVLLDFILKHHYSNSILIKERDKQQPRTIAQKFIGKKNIRKWLFLRDGKCLKCGNNENLTVDHIIPINKQGENKLSNLQTLCKSCNSSKSDKFKDYR